MNNSFKDSSLDVSYNADSDILYVLIRGREIATSGEVSPGVIIDFGSEADGFDVVGLELHKASDQLQPLLQALIDRKEVYGRTT
ncbi:MAG: DUF2283 domain-containing protein [Chloroflexi bacterium]|nr:DUF2283 domain-containing protein [Chloroflexota bacterium]